MQYANFLKGNSTLKIILPKMLKNNLIKISKIVGKSKLYLIDKDNIVVKKIYDLYKTINLKEIKKV